MINEIFLGAIMTMMFINSSEQKWIQNQNFFFTVMYINSISIFLTVFGKFKYWLLIDDSLDNFLIVNLVGTLISALIKALKWCWKWKKKNKKSLSKVYVLKGKGKDISKKSTDFRNDLEAENTMEVNFHYNHTSYRKRKLKMIWMG